MELLVILTIQKRGRDDTVRTITLSWTVSFRPGTDRAEVLRHVMEHLVPSDLRDNPVVLFYAAEPLTFPSPPAAARPSDYGTVPPPGQRLTRSPDTPGAFQHPGDTAADAYGDTPPDG